MNKRDTTGLAAFKLGLWNYIVIGCKGIFGGGLPSIVKYVLGLFNEKVLGRCDPGTLAKWSQVFCALAEFVRRAVEIFVVDGPVKDAADKTITSLSALSTHLSDGVYESAELDADIESVYAAVEAWKAAAKR